MSTFYMKSAEFYDLLTEIALRVLQSVITSLIEVTSLSNVGWNIDYDYMIKRRTFFAASLREDH